MRRETWNTATMGGIEVASRSKGEIRRRREFLHKNCSLVTDLPIQDGDLNIIFEGAPTSGYSWHQGQKCPQSGK